MKSATPHLPKSSAATSFRRKRHLQLILMPTIFALVLSGTTMTTAFAQDATESRGMSVLKFTTGIISAYAYHEVGHALAAAATGTDIEWGMGTYNQPLGFTEHADSDSSGFILHASGLATQLIASEIILHSDSIDKNDNFVRGMMFWNIINPLVYALDYWYIGRANKAEEGSYQGDLQGMEHYSDRETANLFTAGMTALTLYQGYRFIKTQDWAPDWIKRDAMRLNFQSQGRDSVMLQITFDL